MKSGFQAPITINEAMKSIQDKKYLLPSFQREFVWDYWRIEEFFDSLMRGYHINSMLFWSVEGKSKNAWKFYKFLEHYRERYHIHNEFVNTKNYEDFYAILDGQQRLTSLYLALFGHYDTHKYNTKWEDIDDKFDKNYFYFNLSQTEEPYYDNVKYEFLWLEEEETKGQTIYLDKHKQKWLKCGDIYDPEKDYNSKKEELAQKYNLNKNEKERLNLLYQKIFEEKIINFYLECDQNPEKVVDIFIRMNSLGKPLQKPDIIFSIIVSNWEKTDARNEILNLVDHINKELEFKINKDLIFKGFLFLFKKDIKFDIKTFNKEFTKLMEEKWKSVRTCFIETFRLLKKLGFNAKNLLSNNAILPILYFVYHKNLTRSIVDSVSQEENRKLIKQWLLRVIILEPFGKSGDSVLMNMRKAFTKNFKEEDENYFYGGISNFPSNKIEEEAKYKQNLDDKYIRENIIEIYTKDNHKTFALLSFIYDNFREDIDIDIDHLHPKSAFTKNKFEPEYWEIDALPNLRLSERGKNRSKKDKSLEKWVEEEGSKFLKENFIPRTMDLSLKNYDKFCEKRGELLLKRIKEVLNS